MKLKGRFKRWLSILLAVAVSLTTVMPMPVYAVGENGNDVISSIQSSIEHEMEKEAEGQADAVSPNSKTKVNDWRNARYKDKLPWNYFHNRIQKYIESTVEGIKREVSIELMDYDANTGKLKYTGKNGRADLYLKTQVGGKEVVYIWEVKPSSYISGSKRNTALNQLNKYVQSVDNAQAGGSQITDGEFTQLVTGKDKDGVYEVTYTIYYEVASDGLIFYHFVRGQERRKEKDEEASSASAAASTPIHNVTPETGSGFVQVIKPNENPDYSIIVAIGAVVAVAGTWGAYHIYKSKSTAAHTSVDDAIAAETAEYMETVGKYMGDKVIPFPAPGAGGAGGAGGVNVAGINVLVAQMGLSEDDAKELYNATMDYLDVIEVFIGEDFANELFAAMEQGDIARINELLKLIQEESEDFDKAGEAQPPRDPLVIDLGATGIELHSLENGVYFDLDNNGFSERTAWIGTEDGFLALDRDGNGRIDNGGELFGDQVILENGEKSSSGFGALAELDENEDKVIDSADAGYGRLQVWVDRNHNGVSESNELKTLAELGICSISLDHREISFIDDETGTRIAETADVEISRDGSTVTVEISEFWFPVNASDTTHGSTVTAGNVPGIDQAIEADESGRLRELVAHFRASDDIIEKRYDVKQILYLLTGASEIAPNSRGGNMDARDLAVIEAFMGREFNGVGGTSPNVNAAAILKDICMDIENRYYSILNLDAGLGGYLYAGFVYEDGDGNEDLNLSLLYYSMDVRIAEGENIDTMLYDLLVYLQSYDAAHGTDTFRECSDYYAPRSTRYAELVELSRSGSIYIGTEGDDSYAGTGRNDFIFGEAGHDVLSGGAGMDVIHGGTGNDTLYGNGEKDHLYGGEGDDILDGGAGDDILEDAGGNDVYIFAKGYGTDRIIDSGGSNTLRFVNLTAKDIRVNGTDEYDVTIQIRGTGDQLIIQSFRERGELADYTLEFQDQTMHCTDAGSPFRHIYGSDADDDLKAVVPDSMITAFEGDDRILGSKGRDIIYGNGGSDRISAGDGEDAVYGGSGDDQLCGETGDDILFGGEGQDSLDGGSGDDFLFGGSGDDTYRFAKGYGTDVIEDMEGISTIRLGDDLRISDIFILAIGEEALLGIKNAEDLCIIRGYGRKPGDYVLSDGTDTVSMKDIIAEMEEDVCSGLRLVPGTEGSDAIFAEAGRNLIAAGGQYDYIIGSTDRDLIFGDGDTDRILAGDGADVIFGSEGSDQLYGEEGNDFLAGGSENDYMNGGAGDGSLLSGSGDDFMEGGAGDDVYYFHAGDGRDSILDKEGQNVIIFGDGLCSDDVKAYRSNWNDLLITFAGLDDSLIIKDYCIDETARSFRLVFSDGMFCAAVGSDSVLRSIYDTTATEYMPTVYADGITLISSRGDDELVGSEASDTLIGGDGNNRILGNGGDDCLDGGKGRDYLSGGPGHDTYIYRQGYGTDTIRDSEGINTIEIYGYTALEVQAFRTNWNDMTLVMDGSGEAGLWDDSVDKIVLEGFFTAEAYRNFYLSFDGVVVYATTLGSPLRTLNGTAGSDYMTGFDNGDITLYGGEGGDTLNGTPTSDHLYGENGDDRILGGAGDDVLNGGSGNDVLEGGEGNDTYLFDPGTGTDTLNDSQGVNVLYFGEGFDWRTLQVSRQDWNDLMVTFADTEDTIILRGYFVSEDNRRFCLVFADGSRFEWDSAENPLQQFFMTEENEQTE